MSICHPKCICRDFQEQKKTCSFCHQQWTAQVDPIMRMYSCPIHLEHAPKYRPRDTSGLICRDCRSEQRAKTYHYVQGQPKFFG